MNTDRLKKECKLLNSTIMQEIKEIDKIEYNDADLNDLCEKYCKFCIDVDTVTEDDLINALDASIKKDEPNIDDYLEYVLFLVRVGKISADAGIEIKKTVELKKELQNMRRFQKLKLDN